MKFECQNLRAFRINYLGATDTKGSRMIIKDMRFNKSKTIHRSYKHINGKWDCYEFLKSLGFKKIYSCEFGSSDILLVNDFEIQIDKKVRT